MPSKKKKYNARFPAGRIKKIMQTDDEVGKVAQAVPVIISRTLELFVQSLISKSMQITMMKNARTLSPHHMKQCILSESRFDFLRDLVKSVPEVATSDDDSWVPGDGQTSENCSSTSQSTRRSSAIEVKETTDTSKKGLNFYMETDTNSGAQSDSNDSESKSIKSDGSKELHIDDKTSALVMKSDEEEDDYDT